MTEAIRVRDVLPWSHLGLALAALVLGVTLAVVQDSIVLFTFPVVALVARVPVITRERLRAGRERLAAGGSATVPRPERRADLLVALLLLIVAAGVALVGSGLLPVVRPAEWIGGVALLAVGAVWIAALVIRARVRSR